MSKSGAMFADVKSDAFQERLRRIVKNSLPMLNPEVKVRGDKFVRGGNIVNEIFFEYANNRRALVRCPVDATEKMIIDEVADVLEEETRLRRFLTDWSEDDPIFFGIAFPQEAPEVEPETMTVADERNSMNIDEFVSMHDDEVVGDKVDDDTISIESEAAKVEVDVVEVADDPGRDVVDKIVKTVPEGALDDDPLLLEEIPGIGEDDEYLKAFDSLVGVCLERRFTIPDEQIEDIVRAAIHYALNAYKDKSLDVLSYFKNLIRCIEVTAVVKLPDY